MEMPRGSSDWQATGLAAGIRVRRHSERSRPKHLRLTSGSPMGSSRGPLRRFLHCRYPWSPPHPFRASCGPWTASQGPLSEWVGGSSSPSRLPGRPARHLDLQPDKEMQLSRRLAIVPTANPNLSFNLMLMLALMRVLRSRRPSSRSWIRFWP